MEQKNSYSISYVDHEGDFVVKQAVMTQTESMQLLEKLRVSGISAIIAKTSGTADVRSADDEEELDFSAARDLG